MIPGGNTTESAERGTGGHLRVAPAPRPGMLALLAVLESGQVAGFDNRLRPLLLPAVHPFQLGCTCWSCEDTWSGR